MSYFGELPDPSLPRERPEQDPDYRPALLHSVQDAIDHGLRNPFFAELVDRGDEERAR